jgi:hypothetical protein
MPWSPGRVRAAGPDEFLKQQAPHLQKKFNNMWRDGENTDSVDLGS